MGKLDLLVRELQRDGIRVEDKGNHYRALCPFHEDKNPSLIMYKNLNGYRCMSCGVTGDVLDYLHIKKGMSFPRAVRYLNLKHEKALMFKQRPTMIEMVVAEEKSGVDVVAKYGRDFINSLFGAEIRRIVHEQQKDND